MPSEIKVQEAFIRSFNDERLALELRMIAEEPKGHTLQYRGVVMREASSRLIDHADKLREVKAALQQHEDALTQRKHGGVAAGHFVDTVRDLLLGTSTRKDSGGR